MVEYGNGVGEVAGRAPGAGGGGIGGGGPTDLGASAVGFVTDAVDKVASLPPEGLLLLAIAILAGLIVLRRAF